MSEDLAESLTPERKVVLEADLSKIADSVLSVAQGLKTVPEQPPRRWRIVLEGINSLSDDGSQSIVAQYTDSQERTYNINFRKEGNEHD